ncbi:putative Mn2+ efflux pump MntP [Bacillus ectoiniformans]|uniref:manganese efflux pump MntP n=1 Tax=Bacillus ectoiniformans TaxID=1494429 RepID=UPI00195BB4F2|nr:manganese efflux pump [Bacillus ectoiniformans]MBM7648351.1 putative Mn2+ efflux pump MntP [Bacillus ectoiniformans]
MSGELLTLLMMAFALGMDAFSASLALGMAPIRLKRILFIGILIGVFHVCLPLAGMAAGQMLSNTFGEVARMVGGILLLILGGQMVLSIFRKEEEAVRGVAGFSLFLFALSVSLDSFSVGLTLGIYGARAAVALTCFGAAAAILTWSGLLLGKKAKKFVGSYGEMIGGIVLLTFGVKLLLP